MAWLTINIPDNKVSFFKDLVDNLGFTIEYSTTKNVLTEKQIELVNDARKKISQDPNAYLDWEEARKTINID